VIEHTTGYDGRINSESDSLFPVFLRNNVSPADDASDKLIGAEFLYEVGYVCTFEVANDLLAQIRSNGEHAESQSEHHVALVPMVDSTNTDPTPTPTPTPGAHPPVLSALNAVNAHQALINRLNRPPHVVPFHGATLDRNERLKIITAIAICESGHDPFTAENLDTEFHSMPSANLSYGHIVHIGLSYGIIQFTQDSGSLGKLLTRMRAKDTAKFTEVFGNNSDELITLTTTGIQVAGVDYVSGQAHWNAIRNTPAGQQLTNLALHHNLPLSGEIRGRRVQPIPIFVGGPKQDLWQGAWKQRFTRAGTIDVFQEAELEFAVEGYMNSALAFCRQNNVRSALGLAFITACAIRGANKRLLGASAALIGDAVPFQSGAAEKRALQHIASLNPNQNNHLGNLPVQRDEIVRAKKLLHDETGFLVEDLYDVDTYGGNYDQ
jgi:hypothetical protein